MSSLASPTSTAPSAASNAFLFLFPSIIWGTTWLTIKYQLGVVDPFVSVAYRFGFASLLLFGWCWVRGVSLRFDGRTHAGIALLGFLQYGLNYVLIYAVEEHFTSGLMAVIFGLVMVWNLIGGRLFWKRRVPPLLVVGALLGVSGVLLVFWREIAGTRVSSGELWPLPAAILATLAASAANLWAERLYSKKLDIAPTTAWAMLYASVGVALYCAVTGVPFRFDARAPYVASLAYLALFGSVFAFITFLTLLRRVGSERAGYTAVTVPVLAMGMSTAFEGYVWTPLALFGMLLVVAGNVLVLWGKMDLSANARAKA